MLVDVLLPTHNRADVLPLAIESVLNQTHRDLELHVVLDGCSDESAEVCRKIACQDERLRFYDRPKGPGFGMNHRNAVLKKCRGEIVAYMQHDDLWMPHHLETLLAAYDSDPRLQSAITGMLWVADDGRMVPAVINMHDAAQIELFHRSLFARLSTQCWSHRRVLFDRTRGWPEDVERGADMIFESDLLRAAGSEGYVQLSEITSFHFRAAWRPVDELSPVTQPVWATLHEAPGRLSPELKIDTTGFATPQHAVLQKLRSDPTWPARLQQAGCLALMTYAIEMEFADIPGLRARVHELEKRIQQIEAAGSESASEEKR